ncbi:MAG: glycosyltransferase family 52 [Desulfuromonadales bacterium]
MNIYICSTVRNLLFATMKSISEPDVFSNILMIVDQQNVDKKDFDLSALPCNIQIDFIARKHIRRKLDSRFVGVLLRLLAALNVKTPARSRSWIRCWLFDFLFKTLQLDLDESDRLILFNDRNRVARLFRLGFSNYAVIEDGLSNYSGKSLKFFEKLWRFLSGNRIGKRYLGDDSRCHTIYLLNPDKAPNAIRKKVKPIDFISRKNILGVCSPFFRYGADQGKVSTYSCVFATQPIAVGKFTCSGYDLDVYSKILSYLSDTGQKPVIKVHPREDVEKYRKAFPSYEVVGGKVPLELMVFGSEQKCKIYSIYSTAGMGFEQYSQRITLVKDEEAESMAALFESWRREPTLLDNRIKDLL